jgi:type I restriction enzyme M protein
MSDQDNEKVITVTDEMMADMEFAFDPTKYLCDFTKELKYPHRLGDVIRDVYRGAQFSVKGKEVDTDTGYYLLNIKDIEVGTVNDNLVRLEESVGAQYASFALEKNDIVISARGNNVKCGIYRGDNEKIVIPSGNILTIRPDDKKINPDYLNVFLNSMTGQLLLKNIHTGGVIVSINKNQLLDLVISIPPLEKQFKIANEYRLKQERLLLAKKKIFRLENELADLFESMMGE